MYPPDVSVSTGILPVMLTSYPQCLEQGLVLNKHSRDICWRQENE